jgi:hypothetical protein
MFSACPFHFDIYYHIQIVKLKKEKGNFLAVASSLLVLKRLSLFSRHLILSLANGAHSEAGL